MNTAKLVSHISKQCIDYKSRLDILELLNIAQNELLAVDCDLMRVNPDPFLVTIDGVYKYDLPLGIRAVRSIYVRGANTSDYGRKDYFRGRDVDKMGNDISTIAHYSKDSTDPDYQGSVSFDLDFNPGDNSDYYRMEAYSWPEQLTSTSIPLTMPTQHQTRILMTRVMMDIDKERYGRSGTLDIDYEKQKNELWSELRRQSNIDSDTIRPSLA